MKKIAGGFVVIGALLIGLFFCKKALDKWGLFERGQEVATNYRVSEQLARVCIPVRERLIEIVVVGSDCEGYVTRQVESLFSQDYDNYHVTYFEHGSTDETYARALHTVSKYTDKQNKIKVVRLEKQSNIVEALYHHIHKLDPASLLVVLDGFAFLSHEQVLDHINCAYANPDVWMTCSRQINHPNYDQLEGEDMDDQERGLNRQQMAQLPKLSGVISSYVQLARQIELASLIKEGQFRAHFTPDLMQLPMYEMASGHLHFMEEVMSVNAEKGKARSQKEKIKAHQARKELASLTPYKALSHLAMRAPSLVGQCDVVLFSQDRPLHLYAALESLNKHLTTGGKVAVIYSASDKEFDRGYLQVEKAFKSADFLRVSDFQGGDFASLFEQVVTPQRGEAPFVLLGTDHHFLTAGIDVQACQKLLSQTHADSFLFSIDEHRLASTELPNILSLTDKCMAWQVSKKGYPFPFTLGLFEKKRLSQLTDGATLTTWVGLKKHLEKTIKEGSVLLSFKENKATAVFEGDNTKELKKWAKCLFEGYKIDLAVLDTDVEEIKRGDYPLIKRGRIR